MKTPVSTTSYKESIKKSRFVVTVFPLSDPELFPDLLHDHAAPSASHNCWAWKTDSTYRFSDDGEPAGTAGKPVLQAIESQNWNNIAVLVTRFFGGIKLGAGGLIRAYNGTASRALQEVPFERLVQMTSLEISAGHKYTGNIYRILKQFNITDEKISHTPDMIIFNINIPENLKKPFTDTCMNETAGEASVKNISKQQQ